VNPKLLGWLIVGGLLLWFLILSTLVPLVAQLLQRWAELLP
jgi:hypothetical protein